MMLGHQEANILRAEDVPSFEPHFHTDPYPVKKEIIKKFSLQARAFMFKVNVDE